DGSSRSSPDTRRAPRRPVRRCRRPRAAAPRRARSRASPSPPPGPARPKSVADDSSLLLKQEPAPQVAVGGFLAVKLHVEPSLLEIGHLQRREIDRPAQCPARAIRRLRNG